MIIWGIGGTESSVAYLGEHLTYNPRAQVQSPLMFCLVLNIFSLILLIWQFYFSHNCRKTQLIIDFKGNFVLCKYSSVIILHVSLKSQLTTFDYVCHYWDIKTFLLSSKMAYRTSGLFVGPLIPLFYCLLETSALGFKARLNSWLASFVAFNQWRVKQCELIIPSLPPKMCQSHSFTVRLHWVNEILVPAFCWSAGKK